MKLQNRLNAEQWASQLGERANAVKQAVVQLDKASAKATQMPFEQAGVSEAEFNQNIADLRDLLKDQVELPPAGPAAQQAKAAQAALRSSSDTLYAVADRVTSNRLPTNAQVLSFSPGVTEPRTMAETLVQKQKDTGLPQAYQWNGAHMVATLDLAVTQVLDGWTRAGQVARTAMTVGALAEQAAAALQQKQR